MDVAARLEVLENENAMLRERIAQLEAALRGVEPPPFEFRLTPNETLLFSTLMSRTLATKDALMAAK